MKPLTRIHVLAQDFNVSWLGAQCCEDFGAQQKANAAGNHRGSEV
jgi:hypothetical protein